MVSRLRLLPFALFFSIGLHAQINLEAQQADQDFANISVKKIAESEDASSFIIWVKDTVKKHYHAAHSENLYVLEGEAWFYVNDAKYRIKTGDFFFIERKNVHSVKVISEIPLKVLSIQSPKFDGKDRIFVE